MIVTARHTWSAEWIVPPDATCQYCAWISNRRVIGDEVPIQNPQSFISLLFCSDLWPKYTRDTVLIIVGRLYASTAFCLFLLLLYEFGYSQPSCYLDSFQLSSIPNFEGAAPQVKFSTLWSALSGNFIAGMTFNNERAVHHMSNTIIT